MRSPVWVGSGVLVVGRCEGSKKRVRVETATASRLGRRFTDPPQQDSQKSSEANTHNRQRSRLCLLRPVCTCSSAVRRRIRVHCVWADGAIERSRFLQEYRMYCEGIWVNTPSRSIQLVH